MLDCFSSIITSFFKKYKLQDDNVLVLIQVSVFIDVWRLHATIPRAYVWN